MPANVQPIFTLTPVCATGQVTTGQSIIDNPGTNITTIYSAGVNGSRLERITVTSTGTSVAAICNLYVHNGTRADLVHQVPITAITGSTTVQTFSAEWSRQDGQPLLVLPSGYSLRATVTVTQTSALSITVLGGEY